MEGLTALVTLIGAIGAIVLPPKRGLLLYLAITMLYPDYMRISIGFGEINAERIVACLLLLKCLADAPLRRQFRWHGLDTAVTVGLIVYGAAMLATTPLEEWFKNRSGDTLDTFVVYMLIRLTVVDRAAMVAMTKTIALLLVPLALLAVSEAISSRNPYQILANYSIHAPHDAENGVRFGFTRAGGPWISSIMFGLTFATFVPLVRMLRYEPPPWGKLAGLLTVTAAVGTLATLSSGPYMMLMILGFCLLLERFKGLVRPVLIVTITACVLVEVVSNRHFYDVLADRFAMDTGNAWYRSILMRVAWQQLPNYWLTGYGTADPGWGPLIDTREITDVCNDYVLHLSTYGLGGLLAYLGVLIAAMRGTIRTYRISPDPWMKSLAWALAASMIGLMFAFFTVSLFKIMLTVFYILLGLQGAAHQIALTRRPVVVPGRRRVRIPSPPIAGAPA